MTPIDALNERIAAWQPASLLYLSARPALVVGTGDLAMTVRSDVGQAADLADEGLYDCALVADFLEHLPRQQGRAILARLRDFHAGRLLVFLDHDRTMETWSPDDFLGLGFRQDAQLSDAAHTLTVYSGNIAAYNHPREGDSSCFRANPEQWGKYFW